MIIKNKKVKVILVLISIIVLFSFLLLVENGLLSWISILLIAEFSFYGLSYIFETDSNLKESKDDEAEAKYFLKKVKTRTVLLAFGILFMVIILSYYVGHYIIYGYFI